MADDDYNRDEYFEDQYDEVESVLSDEETFHITNEDEITYEKELQKLDKIYSLNYDIFSSIDDYNAFIEEKYEILYRSIKNSDKEVIESILHDTKSKTKEIKKQINNSNINNIINNNNDHIHQRYLVLLERERLKEKTERRLKLIKQSAFNKDGLEDIEKLGAEILAEDLTKDRQRKKKFIQLSMPTSNKPTEYRPIFTEKYLFERPEPKEKALVNESKLPRRREFTPEAEKAVGYDRGLLTYSKAIKEAKCGL